MDLQCALLLYLDDRHYLNIMKSECLNFLDHLTDKMLCKYPPLRVLLEIDVMQLLDIVPELGNMLITEPMKLQKYLNVILFATLQCIENEKKCYIKYTQVGVTLRLKCIPHIYPSNPNSYNGLIIFDGLLIHCSKPESYVYHSVWSCPEECEGNEIVLHYIPKRPPLCYMCKSTLFESSGLRRCGERITATFKLEDELLPKKIYVVDDLITILSLGMRYYTYAVVTKKITLILSIEKIIPLSAPLSSCIPKDVKELFEACKGVTCIFIYCLASSIGVNVCPLNCFMHLKINLLLSLTSIKANAMIGSSIMHVLVGGFNSRYVSQIIIEAAKLADRHVYHGISNTVTSTALLASSGGVCLLSLPLHTYNHKQISCLFTAIETGEIKVEYGATKLKSAVWAQCMDFKKIILFNVANVFGSVSRGDYGEYNDEISDFVLQQAIQPTEITKEEIKALRDVSDYIDLIAGIEVVLDKATENLLQTYFLAARKKNTRNVSVGSMGSLVAMCLTLARLCRRSVANVDDAVFAIWLHVSGTSEPRFAPDEYLQTPADVRMFKKIINNFKDWLEQFIGI